MYTQFFRLSQAPFSIAPDPHYLFMSDRHREALAHLLYGVNSGGGFVVLTGEIGAGKTTVCRCFLEQIPDNCNVAYVFNPKLTVPELLQTVCHEFGVAPPQNGSLPLGVKERVDAFNRFLLASHAAGRNSVLIIDEAQNLSADVLEQLRLLTNLETNQRKLLQIVLIGQPELRDMLARPELEQLAQRVIARYHLGSLSVRETARYILHRLTVAGLVTAAPFTGAAMQRVYRLSGGVPRRINLLCDRALLGAYVQGNQNVDRKTIDRAAREVFGGRRSSDASTWWSVAVAGGVMCVALAGAVAWINVRSIPQPVQATATVAPAGVPAIVPAVAVLTADVDATDRTLSDAAPDAAAVATLTMPHAPAAADGSRPTDADTAALPRDEDAALRQLAKLWGAALTEGDACVAARAQQLHCYRSAQGLAEVRRLERPALLRLLDADRQPYFALLTGLTNASATLQIGAARHTVSLLELGRRFSGQFVTFWRAQPEQRTALNGGEQGADVDWLAQQLAQLDQADAAEVKAGRRYDRTLMAAVREFQRAQGLSPDGIVGPQTLMHLNNAVGVDEPRLQASPPAVLAVEDR